VLDVGRLTGIQPTRLSLKGSGGVSERALRIRRLDDVGDLRRRWGEERLKELIADGSGRASLVDLSTRFGLVSPFTALYVPTEREAAREEEHDEPMTYAERRAQKARWKPWSAGLSLFASREAMPMEGYASAAPVELALVEEEADNKEGGTGTRAKGEEGSMGREESKATNKRYAVQGPKDNPSDDSTGMPAQARQAMARARRVQEKAGGGRPEPKAELDEAQEFGMIGKLNAAADDPLAPTPPPAPAPAAPARKPEGMSGGDVADARGAGGLGLSGIGEGGGGDAKSVTAGQGFGSGHGRLGGSLKTRAPVVRMGVARVTGRLPGRIIQRTMGRPKPCLFLLMISSGSRSLTVSL
jgi:hypothetical protein